MIRHKAVYRGGSGEIVEKKSRFIANIKSVETVEEAQVYIEEMKKKSGMPGIIALHFL